ncbi:hypothetical protein IQ249_22110 [Lusitaniella coriacea LEGE 07157]|uniref:FCP1 homology domain-containing protein n=1 Tax=Lusitaniella coriacea LEGE 07157 TaxID=945747 RepID=A0A8J7E1M6_9CYAN|nr:NIF family HAD-type phosphatase [Lusitaniella coriacea]MBE9118587.1 hypothetical protein [Lusitaniella coriacea LEGE 07157]
MKIAFDLDDTLIETTQKFASGTEANSLFFKLFFKEKLRKGTKELLKSLEQDHELWIYTNSLREIAYIKRLFALIGVSLSGVVNSEIHDRFVRNRPNLKNYSKVPQSFGIDLLIDDSPGVEMECQEQNCDVLIVEPSDLEWVNKIVQKVSGA